MDLKDFTNDMQARGQVQPQWYMTSVQFGFELWTGGPGLGVSSFSFEANASGGSGGGQELVGQGSVRCLDVNGHGTADGNPVQLWTCNGTGTQQWQLNANGNLVNANSGKCLDANGQATANGTRLQIWDCAGTQANQVWPLR